MAQCQHTVGVPDVSFVSIVSAPKLSWGFSFLICLARQSVLSSQHVNRVGTQNPEWQVSLTLLDSLIEQAWLLYAPEQRGRREDHPALLWIDWLVSMALSASQAATVRFSGI